jgi:1-acyl-sn-glycerol-3-phosphate acyltransferase
MPVIRVRRGGINPVESHLAMLEVLSRGEMVMLMPEGEVSWDGRLRPARPGAAWMALRAHAPIVPCAIIGSYDVWPRWAERSHLTGRITVRFGPPYLISDQPVDRMDYALLEVANRRVMDEIGRLMGDEKRSPLF